MRRPVQRSQAARVRAEKLTLRPDELSCLNESMATKSLLEYATNDRGKADIVEYLTTYRGRLFDKWARPDLNHFVFDDIVAVKALSVEVPAEATDLLLTDLNGRYSRLIERLREFSIECDMHQWEGPANELHDRLQQLDGVGGVIAGKLMHAKLPQLIPIWDINTAKGLPYEVGGYWAGWHHDYTPEVVEAVEHHRRSVPAAHSLHDLRILDIIVWKANKDG